MHRRDSCLLRFRFRDSLAEALAFPQMPNINQQVIADRLKISRATVSRCFTNHPGINPKTRAKVFALASKMGYTHFEKRAPVGSVRKSARSLVFGVLVCVDLPNFDNTAYGNPGQDLLNGLSDFARSQHVRLDLHFVRPEDLHLDSPSYSRIAASRRRIWDGVILIYPFPRSVVDELMLKYPVVSLVVQYGGAALNCVDVDHHRGVGKLIDHLYSRGHRRIGFFTWHYPVEAGWSRRRFCAYVERITALGIPLRMEDVINISPDEALSAEAAGEKALARMKEGVTAWLCAADHQAYDLARFFQSKGLRVPEDVSIAGFDGIARPAGGPQLSTIQIPFHQIGVIGAKRLFDLIQKRFDPPQQILLDCDLKEGTTIAVPRLLRA